MTACMAKIVRWDVLFDRQTGRDVVVLDDADAGVAGGVGLSRSVYCLRAPYGPSVLSERAGFEHLAAWAAWTPSTNFQHSRRHFQLLLAAMSRLLDRWSLRRIDAERFQAVQSYAECGLYVQVQSQYSGYQEWRGWGI